LLATAESVELDDHDVVSQALATLNADEPGALSSWRCGVLLPWRWQRYDDAFRISLLFQ
jgi:hypothetical protein